MLLRSLSIVCLRTMIDNAKRWATARGLTRINPVHGAEEYKVPKKESYLFRSSTSQTTKQQSSFQVQARVLLYGEFLMGWNASISNPCRVQRVPEF